MMEKFDEMLAKLKELKLIQKNGDWAEDLPIEIWDKYFKGNFEPVKSYLDVDKHRWYETSIQVIKIYDRLLGIRYITDMFSESQGWEDCFHTIEFTEMEKIQTISYKIK